MTGSRAAGSAQGPGRVGAGGSPYLYIAPFFVVFAVFGAFPLAYTGYISLTGWRASDPASEGRSVGLDNYIRLMADPFFWNAFKNTVGIGMISAVPQLVIALVIAQLLNHGLRGRTFFRMTVLVPNVTSVAAVSIIFVQFFGRDYGLVNWLLGRVGIGHVDWQAGTWAPWIAISVIINWQWTGYNALIYLAGMQTIAPELYEAAAIDGAGRWRQFWSVTVPGLRPTILFTTIVSVIESLKIFGQPLLFHVGLNPAAGGSQHQFQTLALYTYDQFYFNGKYGYGSAISWAMLVIILLFVGVNLALTRRFRRLDPA